MDPGFPRRGGAPTTKGGANLLFGQFFTKTARKWRNFGWGGGGCVPDTVQFATTMFIAGNGLHRNLWSCRSHTLWIRPLSPVQPICVIREIAVSIALCYQAIRARSHSVIFFWLRLQFFLLQQMGCTGLNGTVHTMRLQQHYQLLYSPLIAKTNRSRNQKKRTMWISL